MRPTPPRYGAGVAASGGGRLDGRVALVSGAAGAMGAAVARRLGAEGAALVVADVSARRLPVVVEELSAATPAGVVGHRADVTRADEVDALLAAGAALGPVDVLVNVVGGIRDPVLSRPFLELTEERWDATFGLNLKGTFHLTQRLAPAMVERRWGKVVNVSSVDFAGAAGRADYAAAKAAVASFTRSLAMELAPHVNVNAVAPGIVETAVVERVDAATLEAWKGRTLLGRLGRPDDVASAVAFLATDESAYVTGVTLEVSGGIWPAL